MSVEGPQNNPFEYKGPDFTSDEELDQRDATDLASAQPGLPNPQHSRQSNEPYKGRGDSSEPDQQ